MSLGSTQAGILHGELRRTVRMADCLDSLNLLEPSDKYRDLLNFLLSCESRGVRGPDVGTGNSDRKIWRGNEGRKRSVAAFR
jgi:hypothetical protein